MLVLKQSAAPVAELIVTLITRLRVESVNVVTVGINKNWTLVFVNFSAQDASISKISGGGPEEFKENKNVSK